MGRFMFRSERHRPGATLALWLVLALPLLGGCVEHSLTEMKKPMPAIPPPIPSEPETAGAIWPGRTPSGSFLFFDQKAHGLGDLVTVRVLDDTRAEGLAETDLERKSEISATISSQVGFDRLIVEPLENLFDNLFGFNLGTGAQPGATANVVDANTEDKFEGEGSTKREGRVQATLTCRVVEVLPGNLFRIQGRRSVVINHEVQYLTVEGLVRQQDIAIDNTVPSDSLAEASITFDGLGVIDDKQRPGWMTRILSWVYPF